MKNEKKTTPYESPELELIAFDTCDIITTSESTNNGGYVPDINEDSDWYLS